MLKPKNINDFAPLLQASHASLNRAIKVTEREKSLVSEGNRIYYLSQRLDLDPSLVSKYHAIHMFMFDISFDMLSENLIIIQEYKVDSINIVRDFWAFKYYPSSINFLNQQHKLIIIRISHGAHHFVSSSLPLINKIGKDLAKLKIIYIGATIRQCKEFIISHGNNELRKIIGSFNDESERRVFNEEVTNALEN